MTHHASPKVYCSCGKPLRIKVRRDGVVLQCSEHGIVWRYTVDNSNNSANRSGDSKPER